MTRHFKITVNGREYDVLVQELTPGSAGVATAEPATPQAATPVPMPAPAASVPASVQTPAPAAGALASADDVVAQMGGVVVQVEVAVGQAVAAGQSLIVLEAMKMKTHVVAQRSGTVQKLWVAAGDTVAAGAPLVSLR
ncbi:MAG: hypothetical protein Fur007_17060 [Rhodoferax sp.]